MQDGEKNQTSLGMNSFKLDPLGWSLLRLCIFTVFEVGL